MEFSLPNATLPRVADIINGALPEHMAEDSGPARAYNAELDDLIPSAAKAFALEYAHPCVDEDACGRILTSAKHSLAHIARTDGTRNGEPVVITRHLTDGHTRTDAAEQDARIARKWTDRVAVAKSEALDIYRKVERYSA